MAVTTEVAVGTTAAPKRAVPWVWVVFGVALASGLLMAFVIFRLQSLVDPNYDPYYFGEMGKSIANGHGFDGFGSLIKRRAPLYPIVIGAVYFVFGEHYRLIFVLHAVLFAGTCVLVYDIGRRLFNRRTGIIAGIAPALNPMLLRYIPSLHLEIQLTFLMTLTLWLMVLFFERPTVAKGAAIGLVVGAATLTKAIAVFYPVLFAVGILLAFRAARRRGLDRKAPWTALLAIFVVMGATILPWTVRNYRVTGHFVPVSSGTSDAFLRGFIFSETDYITLKKPPFTDAENASNAYFNSLAEAKGTVWERDDYETDQILNQEAKRRLIHEPGAVARKTVIGLFTFWYQLTSRANSMLALGLAVVAWGFALVGWRRAHRERKPAWLLLLPVFYFNIALALLLALGRYSVPILPALIVLSAYGADTLLNRRNRAPAELRSDAAQVKAVIFDVDGTLYEQGPLRQAMALRLARAHLAHPVRGRRTMRVLRAYRHAQEELRAHPVQDDLAEAQLRLTAQTTGVDRDEVARYVEQWMELAPLDVLARYRRPGLVEALTALRSWGIRLGVLSDYPAAAKLRALGVADYFDVVLSAEDPEIGVFKPHPRGLQVAVDRLGVDPADALYVGDRIEVDAVAAAAAEIPCAILTGRRDTVGEGFVRIASFREMQESLEPR